MRLGCLALKLVHYSGSNLYVGDLALYVFAFGKGDTILGCRQVISKILLSRLSELESKPFIRLDVMAFLKRYDEKFRALESAYQVISQLDAAIAEKWHGDQMRGTGVRQMNQHYTILYLSKDMLSCFIENYPYDKLMNKFRMSLQFSSFFKIELNEDKKLHVYMDFYNAVHHAYKEKNLPLLTDLTSPNDTLINFLSISGQAVWKVDDDQMPWKGTLIRTKRLLPPQPQVFRLLFGKAFYANSTEPRVYGKQVVAVVRWIGTNTAQQTGFLGDCEVIAIYQEPNRVQGTGDPASDFISLI
jgi:hypothetical protein